MLDPPANAIAATCAPIFSPHSLVGRIGELELKR